MMPLLTQSPRTSATFVFNGFDHSFANWPTTQIPTVERRPFVCEEPGCGRRFNRKFTLSEHRKTHTGEKPHVCPLIECGRRFSTSGNLARHKRLHASLKPFKCDINGCKRTFPSQAKLDHHIKIHTGWKIHVCSVVGCTKTFSTAGNLTRHIKARHPELLCTCHPSSPSSLAPYPVANCIQTPSPLTADVSTKFEVLPTVHSPDSVALLSFHDDLSGFRPPYEQVSLRSRDMNLRVEPAAGDIACCSMSVLDEVIEFELTKRV